MGHVMGPGRTVSKLGYFKMGHVMGPCWRGGGKWSQVLQIYTRRQKTKMQSGHPTCVVMGVGLQYIQNLTSFANIFNSSFTTQLMYIYCKQSSTVH